MLYAIYRERLRYDSRQPTDDGRPLMTDRRPPMTTCCSSTAIAMMKFTGQGVYGKDPDTEEPDEAKVSSAQQSLWEVRFGSGGGWETASPTITCVALFLKYYLS
ncbi:MAG: hypothetical protein KKD28_13365 [Chloroflexi bacterium]|nr:hypothetical protein [Chloroflexota bacterium]MBU1662450.1 hypothetical protein [Chloroflexota bacterium]